MSKVEPVSRRKFLIWIGTGAAAGGLTAFIQACAPATNSASNTPASGNPAAAPTLAGVNSGKGAPVQTPVNPNQVMITDNADFYTVSYSDASPTMPSDWKLGVGGNVATPLSLSLDDIKKLPMVEEMRTLECISNPAGGPLISNAVWRGIKMADLLNQAGVKPNTVEIVLEAFEGFHTSIPLALAMDDHALLVYDMNGEPLPAEHGKPLRCLWPGRYGMKQPKWLQKITAITTKHVGYWEGQGWSNEARVKPNSRIDIPSDGDTIKPGTFEVKGIGYSSDDGIAKIELSLDNGKTWQAAKLVRGPSALVWTNWSWSGSTPAAGQATILARVTDNSGRTQALEQVNLLGGTFPDGTSAIQPVVVNVAKG